MLVSEAVRRARWVEAEVVHLKQMGLAFDAIAQQITRVGRGQTQSITPIPDGLSFPPDYQISRQACHKAFRKAIDREPCLAVEDFRRLDIARSEELYLNLQPAIRKGNSRSIEIGVKVLEHQSRTVGYAAAPRNAEPMGARKRASLNGETRSIPLWVIDELTEAQDRVDELEKLLSQKTSKAEKSSSDSQSDGQESNASKKRGSR